MNQHSTKPGGARAGSWRYVMRDVAFDIRPKMLLSGSRDTKNRGVSPMGRTIHSMVRRIFTLLHFRVYNAMDIGMAALCQIVQM